MRVNPVSSAGRANVRRKRPSLGETESERQASGFARLLPPPGQAQFEREPASFDACYHPNSVFMAHLIATRDEARVLYMQTAAKAVTDSYRATAALPRKRAAGHVIRTER